jgi:hypothetical protein
MMEFNYMVFVALQIVVLQVLAMPRLPSLGYRLARSRNPEYVAQHEGLISRFAPRTSFASRILGLFLLGVLAAGAHLSSEVWIHTAKWCSIGAFFLESLYHGLRFRRLKQLIPPPAQRGAELTRRRFHESIPSPVRWVWVILAVGGGVAWIAAFVRGLTSPAALGFALVGIMVVAALIVLPAIHRRASFDRHINELTRRLYGELAWAAGLVFTALWSAWGVLCLTENLSALGALVDATFASALLAVLSWFVYCPTARELIRSNSLDS